MAKDCWEKEENTDKRPKGWKSQMRGEHARAAADQDSGTEIGVEFLLNALTFPNNPQLLSNDPNVWIADSGATVHMSPYKIGMRNLCKANEDDTIAMGNKRMERATEFGDIPVHICDKEGNDIIGTTIMNLAIVPKCGYNLFSLAHMMSEGWTVVRCKDMITIQKDQNELTFNIEVRTPKGVLYAIQGKFCTKSSARFFPVLFVASTYIIVQNQRRVISNQSLKKFITTHHDHMMALVAASHWHSRH
jgi:hypothetical protein